MACTAILMGTYRWVGPRMTELQRVSNGDMSFLHQPMDMKVTLNPAGLNLACLSMYDPTTKSQCISDYIRAFMWDALTATAVEGHTGE